MSPLYTTLLYVHVLVSTLIIMLVLLQKTTGNGLFTSSQTNAFMSGADVAHFITKLTATLIAIFFINTLVLAKISFSLNKQNSVIKAETIQTNSATVPTE